jgi:uncharacterized protein with LGFP repeats
MTRLSAWARAGLTFVLALCAVATMLSAGSDTSLPSPELELAADTGQFDPGNIISDSMFFDGSALTQQQIADFIALKGTYCRAAADGTPCLKDFRQNTTNRAADGICDRTYWGGNNESAATIIWKVAYACSISPKVLLVLLQKEQGLVTSSGSSLTPRKYQIAAGMGCPDTAACDTQYYGFYNQVYSAARQYQRYATYPRNYGYRAGQFNTIQWSPNAGCGSTQVWIGNQATAGLYNYTPYRPNAAALRAGYGTGDGCSAYGNRNFWLYFTDWFGSTVSPGGDAILSAYASRGGPSGPLGSEITGIVCGLKGGGCTQAYQNGTLYWSPATGVRSVAQPILSAWPWPLEAGPLGYPVSERICGLKESGCGQVFQNGRIFHTPGTGARAITGPIQTAWIDQGWENGPMGYPVSDLVCGLKDGGCGQTFQGGRIFTSPAGGTHALSGVVQQAWINQGWENGPLGYPASGLVCGLKDGGCGQVFQGGRIFTTPGTGTRVLSGPIQAAWIDQGWENGPLGYPTGDQVCGLADGGCKQTFQGGTLYSHPAAGTRAVTGDIAAAWTAIGAQGGGLGYPTSGLVCGLKDGGCGQVFQNGRIFTSPGTGTHAVSGPVQAAWIDQGWENGPLGYPTGDLTCGLTGGGCKQTFQGGTLYSHPSAGTRAVSGDIAAAWTVAGAESGALGYPTSGLVCGLKDGGCGQAFQNGRIYRTAGTGAHPLSGPIQNAWIAQGWENGSLGYPTSDAYAVPGGTAQDFQGGKLIYQDATRTVTEE